ncbi:hypothetical protein BD779DRAFT_1470764 [Infundibulicybe gibba]|nr:hypothetical protein BD779DRAFT_1470764 [Infundibulicybe gibba]
MASLLGGTELRVTVRISSLQLKRWALRITSAYQPPQVETSYLPFIMMYMSSILSLVLLALSSLVFAAAPLQSTYARREISPLLLRRGVHRLTIFRYPAAGASLLGSRFYVWELSHINPTVSDMQTAQGDAAGRVNPNFTNLGAGGIGGLTLAPGLYKWTSGVIIALTLSSLVPPWTLRTLVDKRFSLDFPNLWHSYLAAAKKVTLSGGALARNIVWVVAGSVSLGIRLTLKAHLLDLLRSC